MPIITLALAVLWFAAAALAACRPGRAARLLTRPDAGSCLLLSGGLILCVELIIRLACASSFGGHPASFDFGLKCTAAMANASSCEHSIAFTPEFNSFGHCVQGALSMLLLPGVERIGPQPPLLVRLLSCFVAVYPVYNLIKRAARGASGFAASSFANNGTEWAVGFVLGLSVGAVVTFSPPYAPPSAANGRNDAIDAITMKLDRKSNKALVAVDALRIAAGVILCLASLLAAVLMGASWDDTAYDPTREDALDVVMLIVFLAVPVCAAIVCGSAQAVKS